ncbi:MAG: 30S ribosomal protein S1 [Deltaproteobacteria bacterium]
MADDDDFAAMFAASEKDKPRAAKRPKVGDMVKGKIVSISMEAVFIDLGGKAEGQLERSQVSDHEGKLLVKVGDTIEARVASDAGGALLLRTKLGRGSEARADLQQAADLGIPVEGLVTEVVKGGLSVDVVGVRGFVPASQIDTRFVEDLAPFVGQRLTFRITRYESRNLVLSRRALLEEENVVKSAELRSKLVPGLVIHGKVVGFKPFGAFVDIGGIEGMLHVSELSHSRVEKPEDILSLGQGVDVVVLKIEPAQGKEKERISLSLKALGNDPWSDAVAKLAEGQQVKGKIVRLQPFGAFVELSTGVEGLVHISELGAGRRINHPKEAVSVGQEIEATVLGIDAERRRLSLSLAAAREHTATTEDLAQETKRAPDKLGTFGDLVSKFKK